MAASLAKLANLREFRASLGRLGIRGRFGQWLTFAVPTVEILIAIGLLVPFSARTAACAAAALLVIFSAVLGKNIRLGNRPTCRCFGQLTAGKIGWGSVVRNVVLAIIGIAIAIQGPGSLDSNVGASRFSLFVLIGMLILMVLVLVNMAVLAYLLRKYGELLRKFDPPEIDLSGSLDVGTAAPEFSLSMISPNENGTQELSALLKDREELALIFTSPTCELCSELYPVIREAQEAGFENIAVIGIGDYEAVKNLVESNSLKKVLHSNDYSLLEAYRIPGVPGAITIDRSGGIASLPIVGPGPIRSTILEMQY